MKLHGARITGEFDLEAVTVGCPLLLRDCHIENLVNLDEATAPAIRLPGCHVPALSAEQLRTVGTVELDNGFTAHGEVSLIGAHIGGQLSLDGASLTNVKGGALTGDGLTVDQDMFCRDNFTAHGEVRLPGAHIGGQLNLDGATLTNDNGPALHADTLTVGQTMSCQDGFTAHGEVWLAGAHIGGQLYLDGATLANPEGVALQLEEANVRSLFLPSRHRPDGVVDLTGARVGLLSDHSETWAATLRLREFVYDRLENDRVSVRARLHWLGRDPDGYIPQLFDQLATAYRRAGQEEDARKVAIAKQWRRRSILSPGGRLLNSLLYVTVGYGYRTWLAALWLAGLLAAGTVVFSRAHMVPAVAHPAAFHPVGYTLDVLLPFVNLGQKSAWRPAGGALYLSWALTGAGWVLITTVAAALTGILKRD